MANSKLSGGLEAKGGLGPEATDASLGFSRSLSCSGYMVHWRSLDCRSFIEISSFLAPTICYGQEKWVNLIECGPY